MDDFDHQAMGLGAGESAGVSRRHGRAGLLLFALYAAIYLAFVLLSAFDPSFMEQTALHGIPFAVLYGMGLILSAFLLALLYCWICRVRTA